MTKTDWRSEFRDKMNSMITPIQQRKMTAMSMQNEIEDFIELTRIEAQIEVLEKVIATGDGYLEKTHYGCVCELADLKE